MGIIGYFVYSSALDICTHDISSNYAACEFFIAYSTHLA